MKKYVVVEVNCERRIREHTIDSKIVDLEPYDADVINSIKGVHDNMEDANIMATLCNECNGYSSDIYEYDTETGLLIDPNTGYEAEFVDNY